MASENSSIEGKRGKMTAMLEKLYDYEQKEDVSAYLACVQLQQHLYSHDARPRGHSHIEVPIAPLPRYTSTTSGVICCQQPHNNVTLLLTMRSCVRRPRAWCCDPSSAAKNPVGASPTGTAGEHAVCGYGIVLRTHVTALGRNDAMGATTPKKALDYMKHAPRVVQLYRSVCFM